MEILLNEKQNKALELILSGKNIFLTGMAGTGKTTVINMFRKKTRKNIAVTSTTGTSAILIKGSTVHSYLGIGLGKGSIEFLFNKIMKWKFYRERWTKLDALVIDEISMMPPKLFEKLEALGRLIRKSIRPFGGIQLILSGDFCQLPCVNVKEFCFETPVWDRCIKDVIYLTEIIRQTDPLFQKVLNSVRFGEVPKEIEKALSDRVRKKVGKNGIRATKLFSINKNVDKVNNKELDRLSEDGREFFEYQMDIVSHNRTKKDKLRKIATSSRIPEILQLCVGAQVMLTVNFDVENGLANGSMGLVTRFSQDLPVVKFSNGVEKLINYHTFEVTENEKKMATITQVPLKVSFACSIHKSQGCTLEFAEIDLSNIFEYGQAYVALSRVKSLEGLSILKYDTRKIAAHPKAVEFYKKLI